MKCLHWPPPSTTQICFSVSPLDLRSSPSTPYPLLALFPSLWCYFQLFPTIFKFLATVFYVYRLLDSGYAKNTKPHANKKQKRDDNKPTNQPQKPILLTCIHPTQLNAYSIYTYTRIYTSRQISKHSPHTSTHKHTHTEENGDEASAF